MAPKDKTLFFKVSDGWTPLCEFLDKPIPLEPFPHKNKGGSVTKEVIKNSVLFKQIRKEILIESFVFLASLLLVRKYFIKLRKNETALRFFQFLQILCRKVFCFQTALFVKLIC